MLHDLELDRPMGLRLHDCGPEGHVTPVGDVLYWQLRKIARSKLVSIARLSIASSRIFDVI